MHNLINCLELELGLELFKYQELDMPLTLLSLKLNEKIQYYNEVGDFYVLMHENKHCLRAETLNNPSGRIVDAFNMVNYMPDSRDIRGIYNNKFNCRKSKHSHYMLDPFKCPDEVINLSKEKNLRRLIGTIVELYNKSETGIPSEYVLPYLYFFRNKTIQKKKNVSEQSLIAPSQFNNMTKVHHIKFDPFKNNVKIKKHLQASYTLLDTSVLYWYSLTEKVDSDIQYRLTPLKKKDKIK